MTENKELEKEQLLKSISALLDETIEEVERLSKGEVGFSDLKLQPKENGDMADQAGQGGADALDPMKKEDEEAKEEPKAEESKEEPKSEEAAVAAPAEEEKKEDEKEDEKDEDKDEDEEDEDEDPKFKEFEKNMMKVLAKFNLLPAVEAPIAKSEEEVVEEVKEEVKEEPKEEPLVKAQDERIERLEKVIEGLTKSVEDLAKRPVGRKSVSGLKPIMKSEDGNEQPAINKGEVLDKLIEAQRSGDKRVNPVLVAKFEQSGNMDLVKDILK